MPAAIKRPVCRKPSLKSVSAELAHLRRRVEDLEDLRDLNAVIVRNAGKPGIPWAQARKELGLE
ncbi:MAG: hypothetical protein ACOZE5_12335 [Verrucomicrobiota bacterium]